MKFKNMLFGLISILGVLANAANRGHEQAAPDDLDIKIRFSVDPKTSDPQLYYQLWLRANELRTSRTSLGESFDVEFKNEKELMDWSSLHGYIVDIPAEQITHSSINLGISN
jgi:hypothetical protein